MMDMGFKVGLYYTHCHHLLYKTFLTRICEWLHLDVWRS